MQNSLYSIINPNRVMALLVVFALFASCEKDRLQTSEMNDDGIEIRNHNASDATDLYVSTNNGGVIGIYDVSDVNNVSDVTINVDNPDADGIYYDQPSNYVYQVDRTNDRVNVYGSVTTYMDGDSPMPIDMSTSDFDNGRELTVMGNYVIVADDATGDGDVNQFVVYEQTPGGLVLYRTYTSTINLWGIQAVGNVLYAIQDNSNILAAFYNFLDNADGATVKPQVKVMMRGIVRTHGLVYSPEDDVMILTDVGSGADPNDGAFHVVENFEGKFNGSLRRARPVRGTLHGSIAVSQQIRVAGDGTFLGNPVDVAYNYETDEIFIAERANGGGRILAFDKPSSNGSPAPILNIDFSGASAVYLNNYNAN